MVKSEDWQSKGIWGSWDTAVLTWHLYWPCSCADSDKTDFPASAQIIPCPCKANLNQNCIQPWTKQLHCIGEAEEAEYAWLLSDCIKPFKRGDSVPTLGGSVSGDVSLQASIEAASLHVEETERQKEARAASGHTTDAHMSDSDGGNFLTSSTRTFSSAIVMRLVTVIKTASLLYFSMQLYLCCTI